MGCNESFLGKEGSGSEIKVTIGEFREEKVKWLGRAMRERARGWEDGRKGGRMEGRKEKRDVN